MFSVLKFFYDISLHFIPFHSFLLLHTFQYLFIFFHTFSNLFILFHNSSHHFITSFTFSYLVIAFHIFSSRDVATRSNAAILLEHHLHVHHLDSRDGPRLSSRVRWGVRHEHRPAWVRPIVGSEPTGCARCCFASGCTALMAASKLAFHFEDSNLIS